MASQHLQIKSKAGLTHAIGYLECLIAAMKQGTICVAHERKSILLKPWDPVSLELKAESQAGNKEGKEKIGIELKWEMKGSRRRDVRDFTIVRPMSKDSDPGVSDQTMTVISLNKTDTKSPDVSNLHADTGDLDEPVSDLLKITTTKTMRPGARSDSVRKKRLHDRRPETSKKQNPARKKTTAKKT